MIEQVAIFTDQSMPILLNDPVRQPGPIRSVKLLSLYQQHSCLLEVEGVEVYLPLERLYREPKRFGETPSLTAQEVEEMLAAPKEEEAATEEIEVVVEETIVEEEEQIQ